MFFNIINLFKKSLETLWKMEKKVGDMIGLAIDSYVNDDDEMSYKICQKDDEIDSFYKSLLAIFIDEIKF